MKNFGFTLVELLGVIIILGVILTIVTISVGSVLDKSESSLTKVQIKKIEEAAKNYYVSEGMTDIDFENDKFNRCVSVEYLLENGYMEESELPNIKTKQNNLGSVRISYDSKKYQYKYVEDDCTVCSLIYDTGDEGISEGDKYQCKVKDDMEEGFEDGYYFFVLGTNSDGTTNLIMERNIYYDSTNDVGLVATSTNSGLVAWYSPSQSNSFGPVTAMDYLYNATKDWSNVPNIVMSYEDEGNTGSDGYGTIITTNNITKIAKKDTTAVTVLTDKEGYTNLKARMPRYDEVTGEGKCTISSGSCPLYLANYLNNSSYYKEEDGKIDINGIKGYWTLSSYAGISNFAWIVDYYGYVYISNVDIDSYHGVRPVITIPNSRFENNNW